MTIHYPAFPIRNGQRDDHVDGSTDPLPVGPFSQNPYPKPFSQGGLVDMELREWRNARSKSGTEEEPAGSCRKSWAGSGPPSHSRMEWQVISTRANTS
jgi:hypothetical protein